jgi:beta-lactam-binding protein with PASTA domain
MKSLFRFALLGLVLLVVALVSALTAMRFAIHGSEVNVPDLVGKTPAEAARMAESNGLQLKVERQYYSPKVPEGKILSQLPVAGTQVRRGWQVRVAESLGPQRVEIPSLLGQSERAAEMNTLRRGLEVGAVAHLQLPGVPVEQVVSQSPPPNASGVSAPKIGLLVAESSAPEAFVMPSLVGQTLSNAAQELQSAGLRVGSVVAASQPAPSAIPLTPPTTGVVVAQDPPPGTKITAGTAVNFEVR